MDTLLKVISFIVISLFLYVGVLNVLPDKALSPSATAWLQHDGEAVPIGQNSHYLLWGLNAPAGVSMREYGEAVVEAMVQAGDKIYLSDIDADESYFPEAYDRSMEIHAVGLGDWCKPSERFCLDEYGSSAAKRLLQGDNALLLERYRKMSKLQYYHKIEPLGVNSIPYYSPLANGQRLRHLAIASQFLNGKHDKALDELAADLHFSRMLLREADTLILKMVAIRLVTNCLHLYGQLLEQPDVDSVVRVIADIAPLTEAERNFEKVFRGELRFQQSAIKHSSDDVAWEGGDLFDRFLYGLMPIRGNHFLNISHGYMQSLLELHPLPPTQFKIAQAKRAAEYPGIRESLYSPLNAILLSISMPMYSSYLLKTNDLGGLIRMVKLKGEIIANDVPVESLDAYIATSPYASAYSQESVPVRWSREKHTLCFSPVDDENRGEATKLYLGLRPIQSTSQQGGTVGE